jgi:dephospho-CoA kinase
MTTPSSNNNNIIIGLVGVERSGKDTIADYLVANHNFKKHNMANPIREIAKIMFNWTTDLLTGPAKDIVDPITGIKPRDFFTWFGTDIAQFAIYEQFPALESTIPPRTIWARAMTAFIKTYINSHNIVIPDIRFIHEAKALLDTGGILVRISNPDRETDAQLNKYDLAQLMSSSNTYINAATTLNNTGTVPELYDNIETLLDSLDKKQSCTVLQLDTSNSSMFI